MKVIQRIHKGYREWQQAKKKGINFDCYFGKYQYIYSSLFGKISLIHLDFSNIFRQDKYWEIYCLKGHLFDDCERFDNKIDAEIRIQYYLGMKYYAKHIINKIKNLLRRKKQ